MTSAEQRTLFRELVNETDTTALSDDRIDYYLKAGARALNDLIAYYVVDDTSTMTIAAGTQEYALPADLIEVLWVEMQSAMLTLTDEQKLLDEKQFWRTAPANIPKQYYLTGHRKMGFFPKPAGAYSYVLRYVGTPTDAITNLATQHRDIPVFWAAGLWLTSANGVAVAQAKNFFDLAMARAKAAEAYYAAMKPKR